MFGIGFRTLFWMNVCQKYIYFWFMQDLEKLKKFLNENFAQANDAFVEEIGDGTSIVGLKIEEKHLRPGGTVSGPIVMGIADFALYIAIFGSIGVTPMAVTTSLNFNFLRMPCADEDLVAKCKLLKIGKRLAMGEVSIHSGSLDTPAVAHATGTYSIPPKD